MWNHISVSDVLAAGGTPITIKPGSALSASASDEFDRDFIVYCGTNDHVHMIRSHEDGGNFEHFDMHAHWMRFGITPPDVAKGPCSFSFEELDSALIVFVGVDGHFHYQIFKERWQYWNLNTAVFDGSLPAVKGDVNGFAFEESETMNIIFHAVDDHLHILQYNHNSVRWVHRDFHADEFSNSIPTVKGAICGFADEDKEHMVLAYVNSNDQISRIFHEGAGWRHEELDSATTGLATIPPIKLPDSLSIGGLSGYATEEGESQNIVYRGTDNHLNLLRVTDEGRWQYFDFDSLDVRGDVIRVGGEVASYSNEDAETQNIVYIGMDNEIHKVSASSSSSSWWSDFTDALGEIFTSVGEVIGAVLLLAVNLVTDLIDIIAIGLAALFDYINLSWFGGIIESFLDLVSAVIRGVVDIVRGIIEGVFGVIGGVLFWDDEKVADAILVDFFGGIVGAFLHIVFKVAGVIHSVFGFIWGQGGKRGLTASEIAFLRPIFGNSISYFVVRVIDGNAGFFDLFDFSNNGRPITDGNTIYMKTNGARVVGNARYNAVLVHECIHVWQYQTTGVKYLSDAAFSQAELDDAYDWEETYGTRTAWVDFNPESQGAFIEHLFDGNVTGNPGAELVNAAGLVTDMTPGAFFRADGTNTFGRFIGAGGFDNTKRALAAVFYIKTRRAARLSGLFRPAEIT